MPGTHTFEVTSPITPLEAVINQDLIAIFTPFVDGVLPTLKNTDKREERVHTKKTLRH